ncbi:MAG: c-type cytochrome [Gemmatimonadaceae bacterium]
MNRTKWTTAAGICMLGSVVQCTAAQTKASPAPAPVVAAAPAAPAPVVAAAPAAASPIRDTSMKTTQLGVYTNAQAARGAQTYATTCGSCHTPSSHTGTTYNQNWQGHPLSDLFLYISTQMPQDNPGSLDPNTAADVVAFLLKTYSMPAGTTELAPDTLAMKKILIDSRAQRPPQ